MIKKAMILGAGFGKRLQPFTLTCPKPLLRIGNQTLLSNTISFLEKLQIQQVVINIHYLGEQIEQYVSKKKCNLEITVIKEKEKILDTGGGMLNALKYLGESFLCINPDTIWNNNYINEVKTMEKDFSLNKKECFLLVVDKKRSFDKNLKGDFNLFNGQVNRKQNKNLNYIYTGLQIIRPEAFSNISDKIFSINKVWDELIKKNKLFGLESNIDFTHISNLNIYKKLNIK